MDDLPSLSPSSADLITRMVKCIHTIESSGAKHIEDWETVQARQEGEHLLRELERKIIPLHKRLRLAGLSVYENQALYLTVQLGIAQALVDAGPDGMDINTLASHTGTLANPLKRILYMLQAWDVTELHGDHWVAGESALALCPGYAGSVASEMDIFGNEIYTVAGFLGKQVAPDREWPVRQALTASSPSAGSVSATQACLAGLGVPHLYAHLAAHSDRQDVFTDSMTSRSLRDDKYMIIDYPWERHANQRLCDIGGADGNLFKQLLVKHPSIAGGTIYDISTASPPVDAPTTLTYIHGDFFATIPVGYQVYFMRQIVHNWGDSDVRRILCNVRKAMAKSYFSTNSDANHSGGKKGPILLIAEVVATSKMQREVAQLDLVMLTLLASGAQERTEDEFRALCQAEGLRLVQVWPTRGKYSILEVHFDFEIDNQHSE
ncbi:hypothetical protein BGZ94_010023 [Podila epigama]|nr:hypothetical protein BGZ94_010023 [Podila epigama]